MFKRMLLVALMAAALAGCEPRKLIVWSPDAQRAAVIGESLRLCDGEGALSEPLADSVGQVAWFADSRRLLTVREVSVGTWEQFASAIPAVDVERIKALSEKLRDEILASPDKWDAEKSQAVKAFVDGELAGAILYLRDVRNEGLPEKVGPDWKEVDKATAPYYLMEIRPVDGLSLGRAERILLSLAPITEPRISPDDRYVAYVSVAAVENGRETAPTLNVVAVQPGAKPRKVAERVAERFDWSADGRQLVFAFTTAPQPADDEAPLRMGFIARAQVRDEAGELPRDLPGPREEIATVVFTGKESVRAMKDGSVLFAAVGLSLPSAQTQPSEQMSLYLWSAGGPAAPASAGRVTKLTAGSIPSRADLFELSPDRMRVSIPGGDGTVAVLTLATGEVTIAQPAVDPENKLRCIPVWRPSATAGDVSRREGNSQATQPGSRRAGMPQDELCFVAPPGSPLASERRGEFVLWAGPDKVKVISRDWPDLAVPELIKSQPQTQPANE